MTDPETQDDTEETLEVRQMARLLNVFETLKTFDARERVITVCEDIRDEEAKAFSDEE